MAINITAATKAAKDSFNTTPINILKVEWGGVTGNKFYSDRLLAVPYVTESDLVTSWGDFNNNITEAFSRSSKLTVAINDTSGNLKGYLEGIDVINKAVTIYQYFDSTTAFVSYAGALVDLKYSDNNNIVEFSISGLATRYEKNYGTIATTTNFTDLAPEDEGKMLPLIVGSVQRTEGAVQVTAPNRTALTKVIKWDSSVAVVGDTREFEQNVYGDFFIGKERVYAKVEGSKMTMIQRGMTVQAGYVASVPNISCFAANFAPAGAQWVGYKVKFFVGTASFEKTITSYTSPNIYGVDTAMPFNMAGTVYYELYTPASSHEAGEEVREILDEYVWILNDAPSTSVEAIQMKGGIIVSSQKKVDTWVDLDSDLYTINLNDNTWAASIGHNVTSITLKFDPKHLQPSPYQSSEFFITATGVNYDNPIDIIQYLAGLLGVTSIDATSFAAAKTASSWLKLGSLYKDEITFDTLLDIALQSRISLWFQGGTLYAKYLSNSTEASINDITTSDYKEETFTERVAKDDIINKLYCTYNFDGTIKRFELVDSGSVAKYGERTRRIDFWAHTKEGTARDIATFWLQKWSKGFIEVEVDTFLNTIEVMPHDWVTINGDKAEVIDKRVSNGSVANIDNIHLKLRKAIYAGCSGSCEMIYETGCSSSCEQHCQTSSETACSYACETANQAACSLTCVTTCELVCTSLVENYVPNPCANTCESSCVSGGCEASACETACQFGCQIGGCTSGATTTCLGGCEIGCTAACQAGKESCTGSCQTACQSACTTGCEAACQSYCQLACEGACTSTSCTTCQAGCQTGTEGCSACCEIACETSCQHLCEAGSCRSGCTASLTAEDSTSCQSKCELSCQAACEGSCQTCCQAAGTEGVWHCISACQTGCQQNCETASQTFDPGPGACVISCQATCMTSATTGCADYCTVGCQCFCQVTCETNCTTGSCMTDCQCDCQTAGPMTVGCNSSTEGACFSSCQGYCETSNTTTDCAMACQAHCMSDLQTGCTLYCTAACRCACQVSCTSISCTTACETDCMCQCQTNAESIADNQKGPDAYYHTCSVWGCTVSAQTQMLNWCSTNCTVGCITTCTSFCEGSATTGCGSSCQGWCMNEIQTGCTLYCTVGCRCACMVTCESCCRSGGCEESCQCFCQTSSCQTASG